MLQTLVTRIDHSVYATTGLTGSVADGIVSFFIDWADSPHPAASAPAGPVLESLRVEHPDPAYVIRALSDLGIHLSVEPGPRPALIAAFRTEKGIVVLR